ncbi:hypothetical protein [Aureivirga marina]|uniref:hypothetical protein n=1 Tax=Aureivirga marina TaxID=1182451 RepID=UPI0018CAD918|nr:hypothetical protein [Aureivirga marina]
MKFKLLIVLLFISISIFGQSEREKFDKDYDQLLVSLMNEKWENAFNSSKELRERINNEVEFEKEAEILNYIIIYATAGLMNEGKLTKEESLEKVKYLKGRTMILPSHPFNPECFTNCTHFSEDENYDFSTIVNNANGTQIFCFESVKLKGELKHTKEELTGKYIFLSGKLDEISVEGFSLPRFNLKFSEGEYTILER